MKIKWNWTHVLGGVAAVGGAIGINSYLTKQPRIGDVATVQASNLSASGISLAQLPASQPVAVSITQVPSGNDPTFRGSVQGIAVSFPRAAILSLTRAGKVIT